MCLKYYGEETLHSELFYIICLYFKVLVTNYFADDFKKNETTCQKNVKVTGKFVLLFISYKKILLFTSESLQFTAQ